MPVRVLLTTSQVETTNMCLWRKEPVHLRLTNSQVLLNTGKALLVQRGRDVSTLTRTWPFRRTIECALAGFLKPFHGLVLFDHGREYLSIRHQGDEIAVRDSEGTRFFPAEAASLLTRIVWMLAPDQGLLIQERGDVLSITGPRANRLPFLRQGLGQGPPPSARSQPARALSRTRSDASA